MTSCSSVTTLKMEAAHPSETPTCICQSSRCCVPEYSNLHGYIRENFRSHNKINVHFQVYETKFLSLDLLARCTSHRKRVLLEFRYCSLYAASSLVLLWEDPSWSELDSINRDETVVRRFWSCWIRIGGLDVYELTLQQEGWVVVC